MAKMICVTRRRHKSKPTGATSGNTRQAMLQIEPVVLLYVRPVMLEDYNDSGSDDQCKSDGSVQRHAILRLSSLRDDVVFV